MSKEAIDNNSVVTIRYSMADMSGALLERSESRGFRFRMGNDAIFRKLETSLLGRFEGEGFFVALEPHEAFGDYDPDAMMMVPVRQLGDAEAVTVGLVYDSVPGATPDGRQWWVTDIADGMAVLEANHPWAGIGVQFEIRVLKVENGSTDEVISDVPSFLSVAPRDAKARLVAAGSVIPEDYQLVPEDDEDDLTDEEMDRMLMAQRASMAKPDPSPMDRMARSPRIIR